MSKPDRNPLTPQQQIDMLEQQLMEAQKMSALGLLVGTTTHEFNNLLMTIINYAKLGMRANDEASRTKAFDKILAAGNRAAKITNGVLGFARNRSTGFEPTDLQRIIDDTLVLVDRELQKHRVQLDLKISPVPKVMANGNQIQQVLLNLIINARQAMADGGRLIIGLKLDADASMVELSVRDTGSGMPPEILHRIFDNFFTTKSGADATGRGGTGLGLAACRHIIETHKGKVRVESAPGKGTLFTIKLPAVVATPIVPPLVPTFDPRITPPTPPQFDALH
ncbi:MAG: ATP-binding protein [Planctomycetaceae bacterium]|nr:ATP-binding protein [Planctomycetaceae bacterium]